jgi:hypothetical protein
MSDDNDESVPGADDDGWGDAGEAAETPEPEAPPTPVDPANLEERVAALREKRESAKVVVQESATAATESEPPAAVQTYPETPSVQTYPETPSVQTYPETPVQQTYSPTTASSEYPVAEPVASDDAPPWTPDSQELPPPPSDLLAASKVLAEKENEPSARKRRKLEKRKERDPRTQLTRRQQLTLIGGAALFILASVGAVLGWMNNQRYYLVCGTRSITAEQGSFWPWGRARLPGEAFGAIEGDHPCTGLEFDNRSELEEAFLDALIEQATRLLTSGDPDKVASAEQQLVQALLLSRDPERGKKRAMAERLQGDVSYWRGAAEIQNALEVLSSSAGYFEEAATKRPRHSNDASAWAEHARYIGSEIDKGPKSLRKDESPKEEPHFQGLTPPPPVAEDPKPDDPPAVNTSKVAEPPVDAGMAQEPPPPPPADAGLPKGGVLL